MSVALRLELGRAVRDRMAWLLGAAFAAACAVLFASAHTEATAFRTEAERTAQIERQRWLNQDPKNPHSAAHYGVWLFKPVSPLAALDPGIDPYVGRAVRIEAHRYNDAVFRAAQDRPTLARSGVASVADAYHLLLPLVAVLLGFAAFAADRERGTLRLALGNGVSLGGLFAKRLLSRGLVLALIATVPALVLGGIAVAGGSGSAWAPLSRLLLWASAHALYALLFLALAMLASLWARTVGVALAASLVIWTALAVVAPRAAASLVEAVAPTPSDAELRDRIETAIKAHNSADLHAARQRAILARYGVERQEDLPVDMRGLMLHEREQHDYGVFDRELGAHAAALAAQDRLQDWAGLLSPTVAMQQLSAGLVGSGSADNADFLRAAEAYRRVLSDTMNLDLVDNPSVGDGPYEADRTVWAKVPDFAFRPAPLARAFGRLAVPSLTLLLWIIVVGGIIVAASRRVKL
jgi:ABC-2 type transport system permease protein